MPREMKLRSRRRRAQSVLRRRGRQSDTAIRGCPLVLARWLPSDAGRRRWPAGRSFAASIDSSSPSPASSHRGHRTMRRTRARVRSSCCGHFARRARRASVSLSLGRIAVREPPASTLIVAAASDSSCFSPLHLAGLPPPPASHLGECSCRALLAAPGGPSLSLPAARCPRAATLSSPLPPWLSSLFARLPPLPPPSHLGECSCRRALLPLSLWRFALSLSLRTALYRRRTALRDAGRPLRAHPGGFSDVRAQDTRTLQGGSGRFRTALDGARRGWPVLDGAGRG